MQGRSGRCKAGVHVGGEEAWPPGPCLSSCLPPSRHLLTHFSAPTLVTRVALGVTYGSPGHPEGGQGTKGLWKG